MDRAYNLAAFMCLIGIVAPFIFEATLQTVRWYLAQRRQRDQFRALDRRVNLP